MNFYKHFIGDYQRDTGHLSLAEHGAYRALLDHYYATEKPIPNDHASLCRIVGAIEPSERKAVLKVMAFFEPCGSGLMHKRVEAEIQNAEKRSDTNRDIALAREAKRRAHRDAQNEPRHEHEQSTIRAPNVIRTEHEQSTSHSQSQNNPHSPQGGGVGQPEKPKLEVAYTDGFERFWGEWPASERKAAKGKCFDAWRKAGAEDALGAVLAHVEAMRASETWTRDGGKFIPAPLTYLNQRRWEGAVEPPKSRFGGNL